ncbi:VanW family protein [Dactylosporangium sp. AC04546]|uniref:VanW family protein n=1 Tax=Dactylosporangium sp. AC04546 TaxID=2862460 RepID=UPI001EE13CF9|nr:VanW family protein [Dactylosporangium sp. AC04546]WVK87826.1 VanW family protein [Dactylosporangium sp. AC04546]
MAIEVRTRPVVPPVVRRARARRRRRLVIAVTLLVVIPGLAAVSTYAADVDRGVHVLGVDLGGMSREEAAARLRAMDTDGPVDVRVGTEQAIIEPAAVGLALDVDATVERAAEASPGPFRWLRGGVSVEPVIRVDGPRLYDALMVHLGAQGDAPVMPAVRFERQHPVAVYPVSGRGLDRAAVAGIAERGWLRGRPIEFPVVDLVPRSSRADVDRLVAELATPAVAAPLVLVTPRGDVTVPATAIAAALRMESDDEGRIEATVDAAALRQAMRTNLGKVEVPATDATFQIADGKPVIKREQDGRQVDLSPGPILAALRGTATPRRVQTNLVPATARTTAAELGRLGIAEQVSAFTTKFAAGQPRVVNIRTMAEALRGALVRPGETFSLNDHVGERSRAKGYVDAPGIEDGKIKNSPGGGVSQVATTLFNAAYYAGLQDVEHHPHSYYFDRYPAVIEATVVYKQLDLRFRNDGPTGILVDTATTDTSVTVTLYGTRRYEVTTEYGPRTKVVQPQTVYLQEPDCNPTDGLPGFHQEAFRIVKQGGREVRRDRFAWRYDPEPHFVCGPPPAATP